MKTSLTSYHYAQCYYLSTRSPAVDAECEVAGGALAHVLVAVYHSGALALGAGADHHVHHAVQLRLQQNPLIPLIQLGTHQLRHLQSLNMIDIKMR